MDYLHVQADNPWYNYYITKSISNIFVPNFVCVSQTKQNFSNEIFVLLPGTAPGVGLGGVQGSKNSNVVMWHIKVTGMTMLMIYENEKTINNKLIIHCQVLLKK